MFSASSTLNHVLLLPPFLWASLKTLELDDKTVAWLMAVPISDAELDFAERMGVDALETAFEKAQIDVFDLNRASVI